MDRSTDAEVMALVLEVEDPSVAGAREGDPLCWADLYERYQPVLLRYLEIVDPASAADTDAVWESAARALPELPEGAPPLTWLLGAAHDGIVVCLPPEDTDDPTIRAVRSLEPLALDVLALRVVAGLSDEDVAVVTGRPTSRVRVVGHLALARLMRVLEDR